MSMNAGHPSAPSPSGGGQGWGLVAWPHHPRLPSELRALVRALLCALLTACATSKIQTVPLLKLSPAQLRGELALQQRLTLAVRDQSLSMDAVLEADAQTVRLAFVHLGQTMARLEWDGQRLTESRLAQWPAAVRADRILSDVQWVYWPIDAIQAALPEGWDLQATSTTRVVRYQGQVMLTVHHTSPQQSELTNLRDGYQLRIESRVFGAAS